MFNRNGLFATVAISASLLLVACGGAVTEKLPVPEGYDFDGPENQPVSGDYTPTEAATIDRLASEIEALEADLRNAQSESDQRKIIFQIEEKRVELLTELYPTELYPEGRTISESISETRKDIAQ